MGGFGTRPYEGNNYFLGKLINQAFLINMKHRWSWNRVHSCRGGFQTRPEIHHETHRWSWKLMIGGWAYGRTPLPVVVGYGQDNLNFREIKFNHQSQLRSWNHVHLCRGVWQTHWKPTSITSTIMEIVRGGYVGEATGSEIFSEINRHTRLLSPLRWGLGCGMVNFEIWVI